MSVIPNEILNVSGPGVCRQNATPGQLRRAGLAQLLFYVPDADDVWTATSSFVANAAKTEAELDLQGAGWPSDLKNALQNTKFVYDSARPFVLRADGFAAETDDYRADEYVSVLEHLYDGRVGMRDFVYWKRKEEGNQSLPAMVTTDWVWPRNV